MHASLLARSLLWLGLAVGFASTAHAQQTVVSTPFHNYSDTFFENFGVNWGFRRMGPRGGFFFNGPGAAPVPLGLGDPNAGARLGFGGRGNGNGFFFNLAAQQGSSRTNSVVVPSVTVPNGGRGFISNTLQRPFVTGFIPVVGQQRLTPLQERMRRLREDPSLMRRKAPVVSSAARRAPTQLPSASDKDAPLVLKGGSSGAAATTSSANHGDLSVAEIQRRQRIQQAAVSQECQALMEKGRGYQQRGKLGQAIIYYQQAAQRADGELKEQLAQHIQTLKDQRSSSQR